jgi:hypothetical protein
VTVTSQNAMVAQLYAPARGKNVAVCSVTLCKDSRQHQSQEIRRYIDSQSYPRVLRARKHKTMPAAFALRFEGAANTL